MSLCLQQTTKENGFLNMSNRRLHTGHIVSSNTKLTARTGPSQYANYGVYKAQIIEAIAKGDPRNRWKKGVEYTAVVVGGPRNGELLHSVVPLCGFGGDKNFSEQVYTPRRKVLKGKDQGSSTPPENTDGSYVILSFLSGDINFPVILSGASQPNNTEYGAGEDDGARILGSYNGLRWNIDSSGKMTISNNGTSIVLDGPSGGVTITTTQDANINSSGKTNITSSGDVSVTSSGGVEVNGAAGINFTGPFVHLGSSGAAEQVIRGNDFKSYFDTHVHGGSGPPSTPMPTSTLSTKITTD